MSAVPPNLAASVLQSGLTQRHVSTVHDTDRNQRASADRQQVRAADERGSTVETAEDATAVFADAEGSGSQGRAFREGEEEEQPPTTAPEPDPDQEEGRIIDFEA